jgi:hypothetical protein
LQGALAIVILFLSLNFLLYLGILQYGRNLADNPFLAHFYDHQQGFPMNFYVPSYGFVIFLASSFALIALTFHREESASSEQMAGSV